LKIEPFRLIGTGTVAIVILLLLTVLQQGFAPFEFYRSHVEETSIPVEGEIGRDVGRLLWGDRQLDMIALAFLLFVTATGCAGILGSEREDSI